MKKFRISAVALAIALAATACSNVGEGETRMEETAEPVEANGTTSIEEATAQDILSTYLALKETLAASDAAGAMEAGRELVVQLRPLEGDELAQRILEDADAVVNADDLPGQREAFQSLSQKIYKLAKRVELQGNYYWQYCPMAFDGEGAHWISNTDEIRNPYFGDKMLKCGKTVEEI